MRGDVYTPLLPILTTSVGLLSLAALIVLWRRRPHSVLDLWLMVVMCAWTLEIAMSAILNAGRFDLGFYAGRVYGLLSACLVLLVLLIETGAVYARLASSFETESRDRTRQLRELESELIHVSRLTELGQMMSALSHEVNQPLSAIGTYIGGALRLIRAGDTGKAAEALQRAASQVSRASQIIDRIRQFVKKGETPRIEEDLRDTIEEAAALAMLGSESEVHLEMEFVAAARVVIDRVQITQVVLNLLRNAIEAMQERAHREIALGTTASADGMIEVCIRDTGPGLPAEIRSTLFLPFNTTKAAGMGLGLLDRRGARRAYLGHGSPRGRRRIPLHAAGGRSGRNTWRCPRRLIVLTAQDAEKRGCTLSQAAPSPAPVPATSHSAPRMMRRNSTRESTKSTTSFQSLSS